MVRDTILHAPLSSWAVTDARVCRPLIYWGHAVFCKAFGQTVEWAADIMEAANAPEPAESASGEHTTTPNATRSPSEQDGADGSTPVDVERVLYRSQSLERISQVAKRAPTTPPFSPVASPPVKTIPNI